MHTAVSVQKGIFLKREEKTCYTPGWLQFSTYTFLAIDAYVDIFFMWF